MEKARYSVDIVHTGTDAWDYIRQGSYEVIALDIMMPGMSGLEVLSRMRGASITTPVLMLTAKAELEDRVAGLEAGADDYLPKPFATNELVAGDPTAFYTYEEYREASQMFYDIVKLRAQSILGQLDGTIPSTDDGQSEDPSSLIDASDMDVKVMGAFDMGGAQEGGKKPSKLRQRPSFAGMTRPSYSDMLKNLAAYGIYLAVMLAVLVLLWKLHRRYPSRGQIK